MGLKPLEFSDCLLDTPYFRDNIYEHERELERTNEAIKGLIKECKALQRAIENLSKAQRSFCQVLSEFKLNYIGEIDTDDEIEIADAFSNFALIIQKVEEERDRMLEHSNISLIDPLEKFRREQIGKAKDEKRKFDEETKKFCNQLDKHLQLSVKKKEDILKESDVQIELDRRNFGDLAFEYVSKLQEVNEKKKFEFVEILLSFMYGESLFYHNGHDVYTDYKDYMTELLYKLQTTRERYDITKEEAEGLKKKIVKRSQAGELQKGMYARQGYLYVNEKKGVLGGNTWSKHYCTYQKENKILTMIPYIQTQGKMNTLTDTMVVTSCVRRATEQSERRFCFDITGFDRLQQNTCKSLDETTGLIKDKAFILRPQPIILQAMSEEDRKLWLEAMDGTEPIYLQSSDINQILGTDNEINEAGLDFIKKCISAIEKRGINDEGLYRLAGVASKFNNLVKIGLDPKRIGCLDLESENSEYDMKTITSALKQYFRDLSEPILTFKLHGEFLAAIKLETPEMRVGALKDCVDRLPEPNISTLKLFFTHLTKVAQHSDKNRMQPSNLGVVLGPTLMRPREETMAALMNLKYQSVVVQMLIQEYDKLFGHIPDEPLYTAIPEKALKSFGNALTKNTVPNGLSNGPVSQKPPPPTTTKPQLKPFASNKTYHAPPPPVKKKVPRPLSTVKIEEAEEEGWSLVSESSSTGSTGSTGSAVSPTYGVSSPAPLTKEKRTISSPAINQLEATIKITSPYSPQRARRGTCNLRPDPPPKRIVESVQPLTSPSKAPLAEKEDLDKDNLEVSNPVPRRTSYEKAVQRNRSPAAREKDEGMGKKENREPFHRKTEETEKNTAPPPPPVPKRKDWRVRTLYNCVADNDAELSFTTGAIITNVRRSTEDGWLMGTLNGRTGLVPENYCETIQEQG